MFILLSTLAAWGIAATEAVSKTLTAVNKLVGHKCAYLITILNVFQPPSSCNTGSDTPLVWLIVALTGQKIQIH